MSEEGKASACVPIVDVLGVPVADRTLDGAIDALVARFEAGGPTRRVYFVNAHTLNLAWSDPAYRATLATADRVYGDGAGVRLAARLLYGISLRDNVNGTDLVPRMFELTAGRGFRYFLLGNDQEGITRAAAHARAAFPGWDQAGFHHGYLADDEASAEAITEINASGAHLLLVGMGNPLQERWIERHQSALRVPIAMGVGGLMDYWVGRIDRAPRWVRRIQAEWLWLLVQQPHKAARYLLGNPAFVFRVLVTRLRRPRAVSAG